MTTTERDVVLGISEPDEGVCRTLANLQTDLLLLGAGGKIGHGLALTAQRALQQMGSSKKVLAVSRFSDAKSRAAFEADGIHCIPCDLSDAKAVEKLPAASHVVYLAGQKFGTASGQQATTWLLNTYVPGVVAQRWKDAAIAVYSSGNVYPFLKPETGGATEAIEPSPIGEYAQSVLGRERIFEYFSRANGTRVCTIRLNYAQEPRYGVIVDLATQILAGTPIDITQGYVNVVWAGDCNRVTLRCFDIAGSPPTLLNLSGPQLTVRALCDKIGSALGKAVTYTGKEAATALLNNGDFCWKTFGPAQVGVDEMVQRIAAYLKTGGSTWKKPTHFEARDGKF